LSLRRADIASRSETLFSAGSIVRLQIYNSIHVKVA